MLRAAVRKLALDAASIGGVNRAARLLLRRRLLVLCYHGVTGERTDVPDPAGLHVPARLFEAQIEMLRARYTFVAVSDVQAAFASGAPLPDGAALLTFDDGYRNLSRHAFPYLRRLGVSSVVFVTAGAVDEGGWLWPQRVEWRMGREPDYFARFARVQALPVAERRAWLARELGGSEGVSPPENDYSLLDWEQLRSAIGGGRVTMGSHGLLHEPLLGCDSATRNAEIDGSRRLLRERLGVAVDAIAYPHGEHDRSIREEARRAGYDLGFTTDAGHATVAGDPLAIPRILVGAADTPRILESRTAGWMNALRRA